MALALAILGLFCLSCGPLSSRIIYDSKPSVERLQLGQTTLEAEIDALAKPLIKSKEATCLEIGVLLPDGSIQAYGYGSVSDKGLPVAPDKDTIFQIGSISKLFAASTLALLARDGRIQYSDTVRDIYPSGTRLSRGMGNITIYQLATHTSGLPREPVTIQQFLSFINYEFTGQNLYGYINKAWLKEYLGNTRIKNKAHEYEYSNIGYGLLAQLIEVKTGEPFQHLVKEKLLAPLNMNSTAYSLSKEQLGRRAPGHVGDQPYFMKRNTPLKPWEMGEVMAPSGGIYSTVTDLLTYAKHTLGVDDSPLNPILDETTKPQVHQPNGEVSGLGWIISEPGDDHIKITYKNGMASGYSAYIGMNMSKKIAVVVLCSAFNWNDKIGLNLLLRLSRASGR